MKRQGTFDCPKCNVRCSYSLKHVTKAVLRHPKPTCGVENGHLMRGFLETVKPEPSYQWNDVADELYRKLGGGL